MPDTPEVMTVLQAAKYLQISPRRMYELAQRGEVPVTKIGKLWRFTRPELLAWLANRPENRVQYEEAGQ